MSVWFAFGVITLGVLIAFVIYTTISVLQPKPAPSAREILDQRYARGEIDTVEYEERKSKLS
jgi:uncharacterized membrane protein